MTCTLLRVDTNQGLTGWGEVRDWASKRYALMLKPRLLGQNPCDFERVFRGIRQFGHHGRQGGGVSGVEMALLDLAGKAYGVPAYQLLGGRYRDRIRVYCDTEPSLDPLDMGKRLRERLNRGFTFLKMDLGLAQCQHIEGAISAPKGALDEQTGLMHRAGGIHITDRGIAHLVEYLEVVRDAIGYEIPLAIDHIGPLGLEDCRRLARAFDPFRLAWIEDMLPWQYSDQYLALSQSCDTPMCTGEDIYLAEGFRALLEQRAIAVAHPDLATAGGLVETKRIGDLAQQHGVALALHMAGSPVACMASVHAAAATQNFLCLENHSVDLAWWDHLVTGVQPPIIQEGFIHVPETPGLGVELDEEVVRLHLHPEDPGYFEATSEWDRQDSHDRLWS